MALCLLLPLAVAGGVRAQGNGPGETAPTAAASLDVRGSVPTPQRLDADALRRLPRVEARVTDHRDGGKEITYAGTPLVEALRAAGLVLDPGMAGIRQTVAASVLVEGADGYRAVFALAELDPALADRVILLADTRDGQPLGAGEGPLRLVVPGDKRPARAVRQVATVTVRKD